MVRYRGDANPNHNVKPYHSHSPLNSESQKIAHVEQDTENREPSYAAM